MLAEPIVVADGDTFLQEPIAINVPSLPELPPLTYTQMVVLATRLEVLLVQQPGPPELPARITAPRLPELPPLDSAQLSQLKMHLETILKEP